MIRRRLLISLVGIAVLALGVLGANLATSNEPVLGLDLQGGVSVMLTPTEDASDDDLLTIRDLIRDELEGRGIAEPNVRVEGDNIVVDLPGVRDQRAALSAVDVAGIVTIRNQFGPCVDPDEVDPDEVDPDEDDDAAAGNGNGEDDDGDDAIGGDSNGAGDDADSDEEAEPDPPLGPLGPETVEEADPLPFEPPPPPSEDRVDELPRPEDGTVCAVGPAQRGPAGELSGFMFERGSARAVIFDGAWEVTVDLTGSGQAVLNQTAAECMQLGESCPYGAAGIVMDGEVVTFLSFQTQDFTGGARITGSFDEGEARDLARVLNRGAFPVQVEARNVQTVSPTLGSDSLSASIFAGLAGVSLVLALLAYFYRRLITVILGGAVIWGTLIYSAAAIVSQTTNYALTLAGVAGIVVSIGVTVDSYVVYFERLKDEVRHGRTIRNSALRSFRATWKTILAADFLSIMAAVVLFILSVGSVRGFALYLGITTALDVVVLFFFTRPAVALLAGTGWLDKGDTFGLKEYA